MPESVLITVNRVSKNFGALQALDAISLDIARGSVTGIVGPSGCGKSTLLHLIAGLILPTSGTVLVTAKDPVVLRGSGDIGFVFQEPALLPWRTVKENVQLPLDLMGKGRRSPSMDILKLLSLVGLSYFAEAYPRELSGGMKRRVSIARALVTRPSLVLMDEPLGELDEILRRRLMLELEQIWLDERTTVLLVTHSVEEAIFLCDRVVALSSRPGRIVTSVEVDVSRPRGSEFFKSNEFRALHEKIIECLLENE